MCLEFKTHNCLKTLSIFPSDEDMNEEEEHRMKSFRRMSRYRNLSIDIP